MTCGLCMSGFSASWLITDSVDIAWCGVGGGGQNSPVLHDVQYDCWWWYDGLTLPAFKPMQATMAVLTWKEAFPLGLKTARQ